jgi:hypothetical protein
VLLAAARAQLKDTTISAEQAKKLRAECEALGTSVAAPFGPVPIFLLWW